MCKLELENISVGKYRLTLLLDMEITTGPPPILLAESASPTEDRLRANKGQGPGQVERLALTVEQAAEMLGIGRDRVYNLLRTGQLESIKIGKLRRIPRSALDSYIARLLAESSRPHLPG
ncbi:helix-turn-helix domain-containing protein [Actinoallomurus sp. CA-142502]|uniref:helix-turn-helix domain-containing protein n=1 Tax=Actinoallomurus sp. CA-142502 TaxID=3239885 RepID=UPI003D8E46B9